MGQVDVLVRDGGKEYRAPDVETVLQWRRENRLGALTEVFDATRGWVPIRDYEIAPVQARPSSRVGRKLLFGCIGILVVGVAGFVILLVVGLRARDRSIIEAQSKARAAIERGDAAFRSSRWVDATVPYGEAVSAVDGSFGSSDDLKDMRAHSYNMLALAHLRAGDKRAAEQAVRRAEERRVDVSAFHAELRPLIDEMRETNRRVAEAAREQSQRVHQQARQAYLQASRDLLFELDVQLRVATGLIVTVNSMNGDDLKAAVSNLPKGIRLARDKSQEAFDEFQQTPVPEGYAEHAQCLADAWKKRSGDYGSLSLWTERANADMMRIELNDLKRSVTMIESCSDHLRAGAAGR